MSSGFFLAATALAFIAVPIRAFPQADSSRVMTKLSSLSDTASGGADLDSLVRYAVAVNPGIRAARAHVDALRHRVGPAAAWPDPMLMLGLLNQPLGRELTTLSAQGTPTAGGPDPMTMRMVGISQTLPYPGRSEERR